MVEGIDRHDRIPVKPVEIEHQAVRRLSRFNSTGAGQAMGPAHIGP